MMRRLLSAFLAVVLIVCLLPLNVMEVSAASAMKASDEIVLYLKSMEGFTAVPRWDYVQWTVGYGNRCPEEHLDRYLKEGIPIEEADALFLEQLAYFEEQVNAFIDRNNLVFTQGQFDAVLSISYNCGPAWLTGSSDLLKAILDGATGNKLIGLMSQWCTAGGQFLSGLMRRRLTEAEMYLYGRYNTEAPENYCYVFYDAGEGASSSLAQGYDCDLYAVPMVTAEREGYTFLGWYTAKTGGVKVTYLDENLHKMTLYAHWAEGDGEYSGDYDIVDDDGVLVTVTGAALSVRKGPGTTYPVVDYVSQGAQLVITQVVQVGDRPWGKFEKGWISLNYTDYSEVVTPPQEPEDPTEDKEEESYQVPVYATVVGKDKLTVYNGPDTGYPKVGSLKEGDEVLLVETYKMFYTWWGRLETGGWICLDRYVLLHNEQMLAHSVTVTVTNSYLNVRSGPGTEYGWLSSLSLNDKVEILAVEVVDSGIWGRFSGGWIALEYTTFDADRLEQYWHHSYQAWYTVTDSTCVTAGQERRNCAYCDDYETRELALSGHSYGGWYVSVEATCVSDGQERRECTYCNAHETRVISSTGHSLGQWYTSLEPTCLNAGEERRDCAYCDYHETRKLQPSGHAMGDWYVTVEPGYTQEGEERRDCANCDYFETRVLDATEHDYTQWYVVIKPTCTEAGIQWRECNICGHAETRPIEALGHDFTEWKEVTAVTCTKAGLRQRECLTCGLHESQTIAAPGHSLGDWYIAREATCTKSGLQQRDCAVCNYSETKTISATGHSLSDWYTVREATCTSYGQKKRECANCSYSQTASVSKKAHSYGDWYISVEPTYTAPGEERRDCENCDAFETRKKEFDGQLVTRVFATITVSSLSIRSGPGSSYTLVGYVRSGQVYEIYEQATASNGKVWGRMDKGWICLTGYTTLETVTEVIGHTHSFGDWYTVTAATCTEGGKMRRDCQGCTHYETQATSALGHSFGSWNTEMPATCTEDGEASRKCVRCNLQETKTLAATGHSLGAWYTYREATTSKKGLERRECAACDYYEERETDYAPSYVTKVYATITVSSLSIRSGPGSSYTLVGYVRSGQVYEIYEQTTASNGKVWGRMDKGWICLTGYTTLKTVQEPVEGHTHSFGQWYQVTAPTCTQAGQMRRDCDQCDHYETKAVEATGHSFGDWYTYREATSTQKGLERRDCKKCGIYEERETDYAPSVVTKVYATITVGSLNIRSGPGSSYALVGYVVYGNVFEVYEQATASNGKVWGRIDAGWICLTGYTTLEIVEEPAAMEPLVMTVIGDVLNVRTGPGTDYKIVTGLAYGTQVTVYEIVTVDGIRWGRIDQGWVCMDYLA